MPQFRPPLAVVGIVESAQSSVHVGQRLRELREAVGLTQEVAAVSAGLTRNTLGRLESAELPDVRLSTLLALMELYGAASLDDLLGISPSRAVLRRWVAEGRPGLRARGGGASSPVAARAQRP